MPSWTAYVPKPISIEYQAQAVSAGSAHTLLVTPEGYALAWGNNNACQLGPAATCLYAGGLQTGIASSVPLFIRNGQGQRLTGVRSVAGGERHSLAALVDGSVLAWGGNALHQLGLPAVPVLTSTPTAVPGLSGVVAVAAFEDRSVALKGDGTVWQWGTDHYVLNNWDYTYAIAAAPVQVPGLAGITAIAVGRDMSLALAADGTVWYWGFQYAATPLPGLPPIKEIASGYGRRFLRATNNAVYAWGNNARGALRTGEDPGTAHATPVQIVPY
jgi:alpha-tubulin suppressor-like RCC1 family protein